MNPTRECRKLSGRRARRTRLSAAGVEVVVDARGRSAGLVRDAILRGVVGLHVA